MSITVHVSWFPRSAGTEGPVELPKDARVTTLLDTLDVTPDTVLVVRDGRPIPLDTPLGDGEELRIVHTVSGG